MTKRAREKESESERVFLKLAVVGKPAGILRSLKNKGICRSHSDAVTQGLLCLWKKVLEMELQEAQLEASRQLTQERE